MNREFLSFVTLNRNAIHFLYPVDATLQELT